MLSDSRGRRCFSFRNGLIVLAALALAGATGLRGARAETDKADPGTFVQGTADEALAMLAQADLSAEAREQGFRTLFTERVDVPSIARFVLGRYWRAASPEERDEFLALFEEMTVLTYAARLGEYSGEAFRINEVREGGERDTLVQSEIVRPDGGPPIRVDWRVAQPKEGYKIVDVVIEGVSMGIAQRSELSAVMQRNGGRMDVLLEALRKKVAFLKKKGAYRTLTGPSSEAGAARLVIAFADDASQAELREVLLPLHANIVEGPTFAGAYVVEIGAPLASGEELDRILADLREKAGLVRFAERAYAEVEPASYMETDAGCATPYFRLF